MLLVGYSTPFWLNEFKNGTTESITYFARLVSVISAVRGFERLISAQLRAFLEVCRRNDFSVVRIWVERKTNEFIFYSR